MTDYGHPISFGLSLDPSAGRLAETRRLAGLAEGGGLDYLAVQDHPYQPDYLDTWTMISHLSADTDRIAFFTDVADLQLRPPTMLAKAAASLSVLTGGRLVLGVGGGASADAIAAMGGVRRPGPEMVAYTAESLQVMRRALAGGGVRLNSEQHHIEGYAAGPVPPAPVPIWLGSQKARMLEVTGRHSDGWISPLNIYVPPAQVPSRQRIIDKAAREAGRDPAAVRRVYNVIGAIGSHRGGTGLVGDPRTWIDTLTTWAVDLGFDTFVFWPVTAAEAQLKLFVDQVVPGVREQVRQRREQR
ncbi:LLM class flavin-dependent oxidoreductase [Phytohabitans sp. ZYX-F-186]|uniref:LLM class flavin-dependent oxidoreductase n=1 Tax=Phytohabitans maris TaxID=3071409 RepID=A0ABU0ZQY5_9ACTN|nr:LLM class flavin-dependent oxidoreductase [Phytohabitans sp. ZYX-F-186]MDQ7909435.1 LLM class flavin-dependent oxidoreductase [Phytohabitans sp. ZYX-F-186]